MKLRKDAAGKNAQKGAAATARTASTVRSKLRGAGADATKVSGSTTLRDVVKRGAKVKDVELKPDPKTGK
jgi:hypothetical protein